MARVAHFLLWITLATRVCEALLDFRKSNRVCLMPKRFRWLKSCRLRWHLTTVCNTPILTCTSMAKVIASSRCTTVASLHNGRTQPAIVASSKKPFKIPAITENDEFFAGDVKLSDQNIDKLLREHDCMLGNTESVTNGSLSPWIVVKTEPLAVYLRPNEPLNARVEPKPVKNGLKHAKQIENTYSELNDSEFPGESDDIAEADKIVLDFNNDEVISRFSRVKLNTFNDPPALARLVLPTRCKELSFLARNFLIRTWFQKPDQFLELDAVLGHPVILQYGRQFVQAFRAEQAEELQKPPAAAGAGVKWYQIVRNLHRYLTRHGHINFGHCMRDLSRANDASFFVGNDNCAGIKLNTNYAAPLRRVASVVSLTESKKHAKVVGRDLVSVVVVGAGLAGLAAARHLLNLGCVGSVKILESRSQPGGRVNTVWCDDKVPKTPHNGVLNQVPPKFVQKNGFLPFPLLGRRGAETAFKVEQNVSNGYAEHATAKAPHAIDHQFSSKTARVELGAQVITGIDGNPLCLVAHQLRLPLRRIAVDCAIYNKDGHVTDTDRDREIEAEFNNILENASRISHFHGLEAHNGQLLSLGQVFDAMVRCNELEVERGRLLELDMAEQMLKKAQQLLLEQNHVQSRMRKVLHAVKLLADEKRACNVVAKIEPSRTLCTPRSSVDQVFDLHEQIGGEFGPLRERYDYLQAEIDALHARSREISADFMQHKPNLQPLYLSAYDKDVLYWHISNLEFANAASIHDLSLKHWDQDEHFDAVVGGDDCMMPAGLTTLCRGLAAPFLCVEKCQANAKPKNSSPNRSRKKVVTGHAERSLPETTSKISASITYNAKVTQIDYSQRDKCRVMYKIDDGEDAKQEQIACDFVILTTSLGVLKLCCNDDANEEEKAELGNTTSIAGCKKQKPVEFKRGVAQGGDRALGPPAPPPIVFTPPLPIWKRGAIDRLGFGRLNKLVLIFSRNFWSQHLPNPDDMLFGYADDYRNSERRGEFYIFWSMSGNGNGKPAVLVAMLPGNAAKLAERVDSVEARDEVAMQLATRVMKILQTLFGGRKSATKKDDEKIPLPQLVILTRWACDRNFCGTYSYVARGATGDDYDAMAMPVCAPPRGGLPPHPSSKSIKSKKPTTKNEQEKENCSSLPPIPRLLFAGEATIRRCPASAHGAYFSGLREAARIDAILNGPIKF